MSAPPPPQKRPLRALEFVDQLAIAGRYHFTTDEAADALGLSDIAARAAIRRLKKRGVVAAPMRGFHVLVSPEHKAAGCPPAEQFIGELMGWLGLPYYVALLSAAAHYGAAPAPADAVQVITEKNRPPIRCSRVGVSFIARQSAAEVATRAFATPRGQVLVSTPEATALDLAAYPQHAGSLETVVETLAGLAGLIDGETLVGAARTAEMPWAQRLGFLLDLVGACEVVEPLARFVAEEAPIATPLDPRIPWAGVARNPRWRLAVNTTIGVSGSVSLRRVEATGWSEVT